ncbi:MAG TPA: hypothetical protein VHV10_01630 [Ktedonobacteraceae bacterium]|nr:hypothetical protein [Ktedonobacteraceae bacterium]
MKTSTHVKFLVSMALVAFITTLVREPYILAWLQSHPFTEALSGAGGAAWAAIVTYTVPVTQN